jgi:putative molybdopterin biosynthesis protein
MIATIPPDSIARHGLRIVNREPGAEARRLLVTECRRIGLKAGDLPGYGTQATGHLQVASAISAGLAAAGIASGPAARSYGLAFVPLADEHFRLVIPSEHAASREVQGRLHFCVLKVTAGVGPTGLPVPGVIS